MKVLVFLSDGGMQSIGLLLEKKVHYSLLFINHKH